MFFYFIVKDRPELESRFEERVRATVKYVSTIDDFDELVDPRPVWDQGLPTTSFVPSIRKKKSESL